MRSFIDTNVLVYADAADEPVKQAQAITLIRHALSQGGGVLSTQVLQEYANVALRKLRLPVSTVRERLALYRRFEVVSSDADGIDAALALTVLHSVSFYDALILHAAQRSGCAQLWSEDFQTGAAPAGVGIVNPFAVVAATTPKRSRRR